MQRAGLKVPRTHAVVGKQHLVKAAQTFNQWPLIIKPNRGGKGLGVQRFESVEELQSYLARADLEEPLDGIWLVQEYIQPQQPFITRAEFIGRKFLYTVQVSTADGFELCPADNCSIEDQFCPTSAPAHKFTITDRFNNHAIIGKLESFLEANEIDVAGIEFIEDAGGELFVYITATGMGALADYLISLAK